MDTRRQTELNNKIAELLEEVPREDRLGFIFGILMGKILGMGTTRESAKALLSKGVDQVYDFVIEGKPIVGAFIDRENEEPNTH